MTNAHEILGIDKNATPNEIKQAYRAKIWEFHPDRYRGKDAEEKMASINTAYSQLTKPTELPHNVWGNTRETTCPTADVFSKHAGGKR